MLLKANIKAGEDILVLKTKDAGEGPRRQVPNCQFDECVCFKPHLTHERVVHVTSLRGTVLWPSPVPRGHAWPPTVPAAGFMQPGRAQPASAPPLRFPQLGLK